MFALALLLLMMALPVQASPLQDQSSLRDYYQQRFPQLSLADYRQGVYAIDAIARSSWTAIEEFPPYEPAIEQGEALFTRPLKIEFFPHTSLK